jgi:hypothetical protein
MYIASGPPSISHSEDPGSIFGLPIWYLGWKSDTGTYCSLITFGLSLIALIHIGPHTTHLLSLNQQMQLACKVRVDFLNTCEDGRGKTYRSCQKH